MNLTVDQCFNVINFIARIAVILYLIQRYAVGAMIRYLVQQRVELETLQSKRDELKRQNVEAESSIRKDELFFVTMQQKIELWDQRVAMAKAEQDALCRKRHQEMVAIDNDKKMYVARRRLMQKEIPIIVADATRDLHAALSSDGQLRKRYIKSILDQLGE